MQFDTFSSPHIDVRNQACYVAGTRVSLASVVYAFREGASPETILQVFPLIGSLAKVYGAITFALENPALVDAYLVDQERSWEQLERDWPLPDGMRERYEIKRQELRRKSA